MRESTKQLKEALAEKIGKPVLYVKGCFVAQDNKRYSIVKARKITGIIAPERNFTPRISAYGDWAIVAKINGQ